MTNGLRACLVVMPKGHDFEGVYNIAVRPAAVDAGLRVLRADELTHTSISGSGVWEWLRDATVVVADVTGKNPNVYYELGVAQALAKPTLLIARDAGDIPSDLSHVRVLIYQSDTRSLQELRRGLTNSLRRTIEATTDQEIARRALGPLEVDHAQKDEVLRALIERAEKHQAQDEYIAAIASLQEVAALQRQLGDLSQLAATLNSLGSAYQAIGNYDASLSSLQQALDILKGSGESKEQVVVASNLANVFANTGDLDRARRFYEEALELSKARFPELEPRILTNLGSLNYNVGRLSDAEFQYKRALALFKNLGDVPSVATVHANLAAVMMDKNRGDETEWNLNSAAEIFEKLGDRPSLARVWHNLAALMMSRNDPESAEHLLKKSLTVKEQLGDVAGSAASLSNLAHIYSHTGRIQEALELYQKAAGIQENIGDRVALVNTLSNIAQLSATLGERSAAAAFLERALSISELIGTPDRAHIAERLAASEPKLRGDMSRYDHLDLFMKMLEVLEKDIEASPRQVSPQERTKITNIIEKLEGNLIVRSVELEVDMSGDRINISDVRNSVINVKATLDHVEQAIGSLPIEPAARNDLRSLVQQLSTILERLPEGKGSEAEAISDAVKDAMDKVAKPQPNKKSIEISVKGILEAARDIAEALPVATKIAAAIGAMFGFTL